jgi:hypothetical protein
MSELTSFTAGDTVTWTREVEQTDHAYQYILLGAQGKQVIDASLSGNEITVTLTSVQTSAFASGEYHWFLFSTYNSERYPVAEGYITVVYDPTKLVKMETSSFASRMLIAIEKRLEGRILTDHENYSIDGRSLSRIPFQQLEQLRTKYTWLVRKEKVKKRQLKKHVRIKHNFR